MRKLELLLEKTFVLLNIGMQINRCNFAKKNFCLHETIYCSLKYDNIISKQNNQKIFLVTCDRTILKSSVYCHY